MLLFVVPLQSRSASNDWDMVSRLCIRTLRSICRQCEGDFRVVLVCNEPPEGLPAHPALEVISEGFVAPAPGPTTAERMADKWLKVKRGLIAVRECAPAYVMVVDADDCVHRDLSRWASPDLSPNGWLLDTGFIWNRGSRWLLKQRDFDRYCGTSSILYCRETDLPQSMDEDREKFPILRFGHSTIARAFAERGTPLLPLPFPGAVYNTATGENDSRVDLRTWSSRRLKVERLLRYRPLTSRYREAFGLYDL